MKHLPFLLIIIGLILAACASPAVETQPTLAAMPGEQAERFIVLGDISDDPGEVIEGAQPLADYLAAQLKDYGITGGKVRVAASTDEMIELLKSGEVDLYFDSTYPATLISDAAGAQIVLRRWKFGVEQYHSVIFASKASGITSIDQLPGHMVAMDAPYSTSGFMLPVVFLKENGFTMTGKSAYGDPVAANEIGFVFSYDDENTLQWVLSGFTAAGVTDDYHFDTAFPREAIDQLVELARTESTPRQVLVARGDLEPALLAAIKQALIALDDNPENQSTLKSFQTSQFDDFPEGIQAATTRMREMMELLQGITLP
jgi:phosphonate transport system substrate-binding protein